jgi:hypothetical protein
MIVSFIIVVLAVVNFIKKSGHLPEVSSCFFVKAMKVFFWAQSLTFFVYFLVGMAAFGWRSNSFPACDTVNGSVKWCRDSSAFEAGDYNPVAENDNWKNFVHFFAVGMLGSGGSWFIVTNEIVNKFLTKYEVVKAILNIGLLIFFAGYAIYDTKHPTFGSSLANFGLEYGLGSQLGYQLVTVVALFSSKSEDELDPHPRLRVFFDDVQGVTPLGDVPLQRALLDKQRIETESDKESDKESDEESDDSVNELQIPFAMSDSWGAPQSPRLLVQNDHVQARSESTLIKRGSQIVVVIVSLLFFGSLGAKFWRMSYQQSATTTWNLIDACIQESKDQRFHKCSREWNSRHNFSVPGCTTSTATNFNPYATVDDGSCILPIECLTQWVSANETVSPRQRCAAGERVRAGNCITPECPSTECCKKNES